MTPNPQPKQPKTSWGSAARVTSPGAGSNTQGSQPGYKGPSGKFQWGQGQYGYINPQGNVDWSAQAGTKKGYIGSDAPNAWAQQSGQLAKRVDQYGMAVQPKVKPPPYLDPQYGAQAAALTANRSMQQRELANQIAQMKSQFGLESGLFNRQYERGIDTLKAGLGSRGLSRSGIAGTEIADAEKGYLGGLESLQQQYGAPAQERIQSTQRLIDTNLRAQLQSEQKLAKERALAENEYRLSQGLEPKTIEGGAKGFHKRGSTWFYTNPAGVEVSVKGSPYQKQIATLQKMIRGSAGQMPPTEAQVAKWKQRIEALRKKDK